MLRAGALLCLRLGITAVIALARGTGRLLARLGRGLLGRLCLDRQDKRGDSERQYAGPARRGHESSRDHASPPRCLTLPPLIALVPHAPRKVRMAAHVAPMEAFMSRPHALSLAVALILCDSGAGVAGCGKLGRRVTGRSPDPFLMSGGRGTLPSLSCVPHITIPSRHSKIQPRSRPSEMIRSPFGLIPPSSSSY